MANWTGNGDHRHWNDAANWQGGVPGAGVNASFGVGVSADVMLNGSSAITTGALLATGATITLRAGTLNLAPTIAPRGNTFDLQLSDNAHLTVAPAARLVGDHVARIGEGNGSAILTVQGLVAEEYGIVQGATLDIVGPHAHWVSGDSGIELESGTLVVEDGGRLGTGGRLAQFPAAALQMDGNSTALVTGAGSTVLVSNAFVSTFSGTSSLTVQDGAQFRTGGGGIGGNGDGTLTVTGDGSLFQATRGLTIGGQVPVNSKLLVENGGTVEIGKYGLTLDGTLALDSTAHLITPDIVSGGGVIEALSGTVTLATALQLYTNFSDPVDTGTTFLEASPGATLNLAGPISTVIPGGSSALVEAGSGHIVLSHASPGYEGTTGVYAATLEIAAQDAIGRSSLRFIGGAPPGATLQIDAGIAFANPIGGFAAGDTVDLPGFNFDLASLSVTQTDGGATLRLTNADNQHQQLAFSGNNLSADSFRLVADNQGGTALLHS